MFQSEIRRVAAQIFLSFQEKSLAIKTWGLPSTEDKNGEANKTVCLLNQNIGTVPKIYTTLQFVRSANAKYSLFSYKIQSSRYLRLKSP
jgi:hypothetical protein